jgi:hypothetical protein
MSHNFRLRRIWPHAEPLAAYRQTCKGGNATPELNFANCGPATGCSERRFTSIPMLSVSLPSQRTFKLFVFLQ